MSAQTLWVPFSVLNVPSHSANTRLIGLLLGRQSAGDSSSLTDMRLRKLSGLGLKTIGSARARLVQAPLASFHAGPWSHAMYVLLALKLYAA